jgi:hypothetical protein
VRGIKRGHQFDKVEMVKFVRPEESDRELASLLDDAEDICRRLGLTHRVLQMCTGDLSFTAAIKYDVEVWPENEQISSRCNCESWNKYGPHCKHVVAACLLYLARLRQQAEDPAAPPAADAAPRPAATPSSR